MPSSPSECRKIRDEAADMLEDMKAEGGACSDIAALERKVTMLQKRLRKQKSSSSTAAMRKQRPAAAETAEAATEAVANGKSRRSPARPRSRSRRSPARPRQAPKQQLQLQQQQQRQQQQRQQQQRQHEGPQRRRARSSRTHASANVAFQTARRRKTPGGGGRSSYMSWMASRNSNMQRVSAAASRAR
jgi:hypothetical protein